MRKGVVEVGADGAAYRLNPGDGVNLTHTRAIAMLKQWGTERIARSGAALGFGWK